MRVGRQCGRNPRRWVSPHCCAPRMTPVNADSVQAPWHCAVSESDTEGDIESFGAIGVAPRSSPVALGPALGAPSRRRRWPLLPHLADKTATVLQQQSNAWEANHQHHK